MELFFNLIGLAGFATTIYSFIFNWLQGNPKKNQKAYVLGLIPILVFSLFLFWVAYGKEMEATSEGTVVALFVAMYMAMMAFSTIMYLDSDKSTIQTAMLIFQIILGIFAIYTEYKIATDGSFTIGDTTITATLMLHRI